MALINGMYSYQKSTKKKYKHVWTLIEKLIENREFRERFMETGENAEYMIAPDGGVLLPEEITESH